MKEISICPNNKKFKLYEDGVIIKEMNNEEFLKYIKDDDREEKYYEIAEMIHEDMCLLFYVYARLNISVIKFYKMEKIDDIAKDKYNYYELLKHLNEYFNVNDEYI